MAADFDDEDFFREDENDYDVIIVGAGLAGLACAYNILKKQIGLHVLIIEANSEAGGRVLSNNFSNAYHANSVQRHVTDLVKMLGIKIEEGKYNESKTKILYTKGKPMRTFPKFYGAEVHNSLQTIERITSNPRFSYYTHHEEAEHLAEISVEQFLRRIIYIPYVRSLCRAFICNVCATRNLNDVSTLWFFVMLHNASGLLNRLKIMTGDDDRYFVNGGMTRITHELLRHVLRQQGEIRYVDPVNKIVFNDQRAYVSTSKKSFRCEFVVVAIPPSLQNHITIEPPFQCLTNSEPLFAPAENVFFNVNYKRSFGDSAKDILTTWDSNSNLNIMYDANHRSTEELMFAGFLAEANLTQTHKKGLFDTLTDCYETPEVLKYSAYKEYDPSLIGDQIKAGCPMSTMKPTSIDNHVKCTGKSHERILFASSEYAGNWPGTIDGAIQAGEHTAYAILLRIRPQSLNFYEMSRIGSVNLKETTVKSGSPVSLRICILQYLGIILNVAVLISFLRIAYD